MIRTSITPVTTDLYLLIPKEYIGKKVEVLLYTLEEAEAAPFELNIKKKPSSYAGTLSHKAANEMIKNIEKSRNEWERDI